MKGNDIPTELQKRVFFSCPIMCLRSEFRVVMPVTISAHKWCSVRLYLQLFVGGLMSYLRYLRLFVHGGVQHMLCRAFVCFSSSYVSYVASFSGLSIFDCSFGIL